MCKLADKGLLLMYRHKFRKLFKNCNDDVLNVISDELTREKVRRSKLDE